jgi:hypothetical protein
MAVDMENDPEAIGGTGTGGVRFKNHNDYPVRVFRS